MTIYAETGQMIQISKMFFVGIFAIVGLIELVLYLLMGFGLKKIADNNGEKKGYLAFIPGARWYLLAKLAKSEKRVMNGDKEIVVVNDPLRFLGKKSALMFAIIMIVSFMLVQVVNVLGYFEPIKMALSGEEIVLTMQNGAMYGNWIETPLLTHLLNVFTIVSDIFSIFVIFVTFTVFYAFFKKFYPAHPIMFAIFSLFGFQSIMIFIARNNKAVDYGEYIRNKYKGYGYGGYNQGGYNQGNPNNQNGFNQGGFNQTKNQNDQYSQGYQQQKTEEPFEEFKDKGPFDDFN